MDYEEYKRKALEPIVNYIESVMASYSKEELEARIKIALPERESEDERIRTRLIALVEAFGQGKYKDEMLAYLEKQKEQKHAEWSEFDEDCLKRAIWYVENPAPSVVKDTNLALWLKSLRPKPHWKPSEEQMKALDSAINYLTEHTCTPGNPLLISLYNDLQKLI